MSNRSTYSLMIRYYFEYLNPVPLTVSFDPLDIYSNVVMSIPLINISRIYFHPRPNAQISVVNRVGLFLFLKIHKRIPISEYNVLHQYHFASLASQ